MTAPSRPRPAWPALLPLALALGLAGCASIMPDQHPLAQRDIADTRLSAGIKLAREGWPEAQWWTTYHDEQLNALMAQALAKAPTLELATAQIGQARSALSRSAANLGIDIGATAAASRQRYSGTGLFPEPIGGAYFSEETLRLDVRYNFDWWGKNRAQIAAAIGDLNASRASYAEAEQALSAAIAQSYFRLQGAWTRLANSEQLAAAQAALIQEKGKRVAHGLATADEQRAATADLSLIYKQQAQFKADIGREREALRALTGADSEALADLKPHALTAAPHALPARLGIDLLARRPDLQTARWKLEASLSKVDAAKAAFYPDINLSASAGLDTIRLQDLLQAASRTVYLGPTLTLPLFDSKRLDAQLDTARADRNQRIAEYNQAVLQAVRDVAQNGVQMRGIEQQIVQQDAATAVARAQLQSTQARMDHGLDDRSHVLAAQLALYQQQDAALYLQQVQVLAEVALTNALGGGYREEASTATARDRPGAASATASSQ